MSSPRRRTLLLCALALLGFAANSLLCRAALGHVRIDAAMFTGVRLATGAAVLAGLVLVQRGALTGGSPRAGAALFLYAIAFSWAYARIPAGVGALVLFGCVQATMIASAVLGGERLAAAQWAGLAAALGGLGWLVLPGAHAPDPVGVALMAGSGVAWGVYSLFGRRATRPLSATAHNFAWSLPLVLLVCAVPNEHRHATWQGVALASASGAVASGLGYALWYAVLPALGAARAAIAQLAVPVLAAAGGVAILGEEPNPRLVTSGALVLGGVALAVLGRARARSD